MNRAIAALPESKPGTLPPGSRIPPVILGVGMALSRRTTMRRLERRYGNAFTVTVPTFGRAVVAGEPRLVKQVFTASPDDLGNIQPNLSRLFGSGSVFALDRDEHRRRRRLLAPPFHGKSIKNYEPIFEEETLREIAGWPQGRPFPVLPSMMRITLNAILRTVFGAAGAELDELREIIPPWVTLGQRIAALPMPPRELRRFGPWSKLDDWRQRYDIVIDTLIADEQSDPNFLDRTDVLALMLRSVYEDGSAMSRKEIGDELLALLAAGHETTASTMAWAFERITRHPDIARALVDEVDAGGSELRLATILEVQRSRTVIDFVGRHVYAPQFQLGEWSLHQGNSILVNLAQIHRDPRVFPDPQRFDPYRYIGNKAPSFAWIPYGGGTRRCVGAAFANQEMDVVLRTILQHCVIETTDAPSEKWHGRGVAYTPKDGGRIVARRR